MSEGIKTETEATFISRYVLSSDEIYTEKRYLTAIMRHSVFEKILSKYIFQSFTKDFELSRFLESAKTNNQVESKLKSRLNTILDNFKEEGPWYLFNEIAKEINRLLKEEDLTKVQFDKNIIKLEFLLAWHFENNFYEKQIDQKMNTDFYNNMYLQKGRTNYNYSILALDTIFNFMKIFERQSWTTKIEDEFLTNYPLFCSEKIYYFFCDKYNKEKKPCGNIIEYLIRQLLKKFEVWKNAKVNNVQLENYILMNIFMINKWIQDYSFYLTKKPELENIFTSLKQLKTWPLPIGALSNEWLDTTINEAAFQGISMLNKLREKFFIDFLDPSVTNIKSKYFTSTLFWYSDEWDKRHYATINTENPSGFNIWKMWETIKNKKRNSHTNNLNLRELVVKLFLTFIFNSKQLYNIDTLRRVYYEFYPEFKTYFNDLMNNYEDEADDEEETGRSNDTSSSTKSSLDMLFRIIDVGFDKPIEDFEKEINIIANKVVKLQEKLPESDLLSLSDNYTLSPITCFRSYLKPTFLDIKKLFIKEDANYSSCELFKLYKTNFETVVKNYFPYLLIVNEDITIEENLRKLREKIYLNYKINIILVEEDRMINTFINRVIKDNYRLTDEEYENFWRFFIDSKDDLQTHFLLHVVPHYENYKDNPFRLWDENDDLDKNTNYLSEFLAANDHLYKNLVFMPWAAKCDSTFYSYIPGCQNTNENVMQFPSWNVMYSFLKKPLDYYLSDSNGIWNLNLFSVTINDNIGTRRIFWKNLDWSVNITLSKTKITMYPMDILGLEAKDKIVITLSKPFNLKIFNLFFKKNVPFNYNNTSNNAWWEAYLCEKYNKEDIDAKYSYANFVKNNSNGKYFEEFNIPQMDLETIFKNFKIKSMVIETMKSDMVLNYDDTESFDFMNEISVQDSVNVNLLNLNNNSNSEEVYDYKISIENYMKGDKKVKIPVATFVSM